MRRKNNHFRRKLQSYVPEMLYFCHWKEVKEFIEVTEVKAITRHGGLFTASGKAFVFNFLARKAGGYSYNFFNS